MYFPQLSSMTCEYGVGQFYFGLLPTWYGIESGREQVWTLSQAHSFGRLANQVANMSWILSKFFGSKKRPSDGSNEPETKKRHIAALLNPYEGESSFAFSTSDMDVSAILSRYYAAEAYLASWPVNVTFAAKICYYS